MALQTRLKVLSLAAVHQNFLCQSEISSDIVYMCDAVLLICISGAVILHFITRYLYLRAHRQLAAESQQQQAASSSSPVTGSSQPPGTQIQNNVEMHSIKPTVLVVQPDEEVSALTPGSFEPLPNV